MVFKALILLTFMSSFSRINSLMCYNCGYLELPSGEKVPVTEEFGKIPFCDDFATNNNNTVLTYPVSLHCDFIRLIIIRNANCLNCKNMLLKRSLQGGCCSAFKVEIQKEGSNEVMFLSRHGAANDQDEFWANFTCGEVVSIYLLIYFVL